MKILYRCLILIIFICLLALGGTLSAQNADYIKISFFCVDPETQVKGECVGYVTLEGEIYTVSVKDKALEKLLKTDYYVPVGNKELEEITYPDGRTVMKNGILVYQAGTIEHLKTMIPKARQMGFMAEIDKGAEQFA